MGTSHSQGQTIRIWCIVLPSFSSLTLTNTLQAKKVRKLFEVPTYFQTTSEIRSINLILGRLLPCWILHHVILYLFIIKWLHIRRVSSREFQFCESINSLPNVLFSNMKWLRFQTRHVKKCVTGHLPPPPKMGEIKTVALLISAKGFKTHGRVEPCLIVFLRRKLVSRLVRSTFEVTIESVWTFRCR